MVIASKRDGAVFPTHVGVYLLHCLYLAFLTVFPTHVGVYRTTKIRFKKMFCFPHTRGGVPVCRDPKHHRAGVFPTHVGV